MRVMSNIESPTATVAASKSVEPVQPFHESLELQEYHLGRLERRIIFLKERIDGKTKTHQISRHNFEQRRQYEIFELNALIWAHRELRKVVDSNRRLMKHFSEKFKSKE